MRLAFTKFELLWHGLSCGKTIVFAYSCPVSSDSVKVSQSHAVVLFLVTWSVVSILLFFVQAMCACLRGAELLMHIKIVRMHTSLEANGSVLSNSIEVQLRLILKTNFSCQGLADFENKLHGLFIWLSFYFLVINWEGQT
jgi:hypothetical protein